MIQYVIYVFSKSPAMILVVKICLNAYYILKLADLHFLADSNYKISFYLPFSSKRYIIHTVILIPIASSNEKISITGNTFDNPNKVLNFPILVPSLSVADTASKFTWNRGIINFTFSTVCP